MPRLLGTWVTCGTWASVRPARVRSVLQADLAMGGLAAALTSWAVAVIGHVDSRPAHPLMDEAAADAAGVATIGVAAVEEATGAPGAGAEEGGGQAGHQHPQ